MEIPPFQSAAPAPPDPVLLKAAQELETGFLAEMLKSAGLGKVSDSFGGGAGEMHFGSFLQHEQARQMVEAGGIGLAEMIFNALKESRK
ncbi:rod-binding protein [Aestuariicoccus sp. MJ-SS9]|uniref:rod-binding protein n=1 Tax=Aestuariicoccus sp. MJ-SS9 TaxID=3079855 RepID=UPI00290725C9|nr:rod-binding protein [Aestuariicoccus sp. MJ-SS9]MDU8910974.1 rod-binding protein [Aestuariicoccus sp. MJ-SS9]